MDNIKYQIGYIDDDKSDIQTFKRAAKNNFDVKAYHLEKTTTLDQLFDQIQESNVDALVIDYYLKETGIQFNGDKVVSRIWSDWDKFPLLIFTHLETDAMGNVKDVDIIYNKDIIYDKKEPKKLELFFNRLTQKIKNYQNAISESESRLLSLVEKSQKEELTLKEEEELIQLDNFLEHTVSKKQSIPSSLKETKVLKQLNNLVDKTEEILKEMRKQHEST